MAHQTDDFYDEYDRYGYPSQPTDSQLFPVTKIQPDYPANDYSYSFKRELAYPQAPTPEPNLDYDTAPQAYYKFPRQPIAPQSAPSVQTWPWYSLADLAQVAKPHEAMPIAFDRRLVITTRISLLVCVLAIFAYLGIASSKFSVAQGGFFLLGGSQLQGGLELVQRYLWLLVAANLVYVVLSCAIMVSTRNFRVGRPSLHLAIFGQTLLGGLNILLFSITLVIIVVNVVIWLLIIAFCLSILIGMFSTTRR